MEENPINSNLGTTVETPPSPRPADFMPHQPEHQVWLHHAVPEEPPKAPSLVTSGGADEPVPVVRVLSVRGVEYAMMTIALWFSATGLAWVLLNLLNGSPNFGLLVVPISVLISSLPFFALLFIRLKRAELANPALRFEPSKRRLSQLTQVLAFIVCLINISVFVYSLMQKANGSTTTSIGKAIINLLVVLVIAGGILVYYWFDEHRARDRAQ